MDKFKFSNTNKRYYTLDYFYKNKFGCKVAKISLNAGFTCPNIDGKVGTKGCIYCSSKGSGEYGGNPKEDLTIQFNNIKKIIDKKWPNCKYIGYFQARSNTYAPTSVLKEKFESILNIENVIGLSIATRPDCLNNDILNYLENLNKKTFLTIELGLQTIHEDTSIFINRCHDLKCFDNAVVELKKRKIFTVVHIINGLPYETKDMMIETVKHLNKLKIDGIKIHMLSILKNTQLENIYFNKPFHVLTKDEYINIVCDQLEYLDENIVIQRLTSDPVIDNLIKPKWLIKKRVLLNDIDKEMKKRNTYQGIKNKII